MAQPFEWVSVEATLQSVESDADFVMADKLSHKYFGKPFDRATAAGGERITCTLLPERVTYLSMG